MAKPKFKTDAFAAIHEAAGALHKVGAVDKATMREFDATALAEPPSFSAADVRQLRERHAMSQPVFAHHLNTSPSTVKQWESGQKRPRGTSAKLLAVVRKHGLDVLAD